MQGDDGRKKKTKEKAGYMDDERKERGREWQMVGAYRQSELMALCLSRIAVVVVVLGGGPKVIQTLTINGILKRVRV